MDGAFTVQPSTLAVPPARRSVVVDALAARERRGDQGQQLVAGVRPPRRVTEVEVAVGELLQTEMLGERGREEQPRIGHQAVVVEGDLYPVGSLVGSIEWVLPVAVT